MHYAQKENHPDFYPRWDTVGKNHLDRLHPRWDIMSERKPSWQTCTPGKTLCLWEKTTVTDINLKWQTMLEKKTTLTLKYLIQVCVCVYMYVCECVNMWCVWWRWDRLNVLLGIVLCGHHDCVCIVSPVMDHCQRHWINQDTFLQFQCLYDTEGWASGKQSRAGVAWCHPPLGLALCPAGTLCVWG